MGSNNSRASVEELARRALSRTHPEELALFPATATAYFADPQRAVKVAKAESKDEMLGFGVEAAVAIPAVTTAALWVAQEVLKWIGSQVRSSLEEESANLVSAWVNRILRALRIKRDVPKPAEQLQPLSAEQLARVREIALCAAKDLLPGPEAVSIANAVVAGLVLPAATEN